MITEELGRDGSPGGALVATLGVEPQVVAITLDRLLSDNRIDEVVVVFTDSSGVRAALATLQREFTAGVYPGVRLRAVPVISQRGAVDDFRTADELRSLLGTLYREVRRVRQEGRTVHLSVAGGRKVMGITAMVVAQLLFGPDDRVWHLVTEGWRPGDARRLHLEAQDEAWLVPVPVLRWSEAATLIRTVAELDEPEEVVAWYERLSRQARERRKEEFIRHWLSPAEQQVVRLVCQGLDNAAIAANLHKSKQTVANQLRRVYDKLREWLEYPDGAVERSVLIAEFLPYFLQIE